MYLGKDEIALLMNMIGLSVPDVELDKMIEEIDEDGSGLIWQPLTAAAVADYESPLPLRASSNNLCVGLQCAGCVFVLTVCAGG